MKANPAQGGRILWWCPGCDEAHVVSDQWTFNGDTDRPTFSPSVLVGGVQWDAEQYPEMARRAGRHPGVKPGDRVVCHSFVTDGRIQFLTDSTHVLSGQTVDLPEWQP